MIINKRKNFTPSFGISPGYAITEFIEHRVLVNKALIDASVDVPSVLMANNATERKERFNRCAIAWVMAFVSSILMLPLVTG